MCDEIERLQDLLGKANALCRIRAEEIERLRKENINLRSESVRSLFPVQRITALSIAEFMEAMK